MERDREGGQKECITYNFWQWMEVSIERKISQKSEGDREISVDAPVGR